MKNINKTSHIKDIHVTFDGHVFGEVKYYLAKQGKKELEDYELFELFEYLTYGDISDVPTSTSQVISHWYKDPEKVNKANNDFIDKIKTIPTTANVKVWIVPKLSEQFINLCYFAELLKRFDNIEIIKLDYDKTNTNKNYDITDEIASINQLTKSDLNIYSKLWKNAEQENTNAKKYTNTIKKSNCHIVLIKLSFLLFFICFHLCYYLLRKIVHVDSKKKANFFQHI